MLRLALAHKSAGFLGGRGCPTSMLGSNISIDFEAIIRTFFWFKACSSIERTIASIGEEDIWKKSVIKKILGKSGRMTICQIIIVSCSQLKYTSYANTPQ